MGRAPSGGGLERFRAQAPSVLDIGCGDFNWQTHIRGIEKVSAPPARWRDVMRGRVAVQCGVRRDELRWRWGGRREWSGY